MQPVTMLVCDPSQLFREGFKRLFQGEEFTVTMEAASLKEAVALAERVEPVDLVVTEIAGAGGDGIAALRNIHDIWPEAKVVVLTSEGAGASLFDCLNAGADGFLMKDMSPSALRHSLQLVMLGERVFPTHLALALAHGEVEARLRPMPPVARSGLSGRETQILRLLLNGCSNKAIARELQITEATVKVHLKGVLRKVKATNRTQAAIWALNNGFADMPAMVPPRVSH